MHQRSPIHKLTVRPTQAQIERWPSCRILAVLHDLEAAAAVVDDPEAIRLIQQAERILVKSMLAQVDAETLDRRRTD